MIAEMSWFESIDIAAFRLVNQSLSNGLFDWFMPFASHNAFFVPVLLLALTALLWKGGVRGRVCVLLLLVALLTGEGLITNPLKHLIGRPRPFLTLEDVRLLVGRGGSGSMPSAHAANWFAATMVLFIYYRSSVRIMLPLACLVGFSRIYNGVHYPSDLLVGAILGAGYAAGIVWSLNLLWQSAGRRWFQPWWRRLPSFLEPELRPPEAAVEEPPAGSAARKAAEDAFWLRVAGVLIAVVCVARLVYIASDRIELSEDEAYQWMWSKHPALSYYSKPPLIAWLQWAGTTLWGDTELGVRFFSPVIAVLISVLVLRFLAREINGRLGLTVVLISATTPLLAVGSTLLTIDAPSVLFWTAAMVSGWEAVKRDSTRLWLWTGLWMGFGFLSKFTALFQWLCWAVFFVLWLPARQQLRRPGPYLALLVNAVCALPVVIWNAQHGWITVTHLAERGGLDTSWKPTLRYFGDFVGSEVGLLNPVFFVGAAWAAAAFWRRYRRDPLMLYCFSMGAPLFAVYLLYTFRARVHPNWIAPSVIPLFCLMGIYWQKRHEEGMASVRRWLTGGLVFGLIAVVLLHDTNLIGKVAGRPLPAKLDPLRRVRAWSEMARVVGEERDRLLQEGRPVFIIGDHYGIASLIAFYLPEARAGVPENRMVYCPTTRFPENQYYFWPGYKDRKGQNAIYVARREKREGVREELREEFTEVIDAGLREIQYRGRVLHTLQVYDCRGLK